MSTILTDEQRAMVLANVPLVEHIVNRVSANLPASHSRDDLVQTGILGLITATIRFDRTKGTAFSTFAGRRIEGALIDMLRRADWAPRSVRSMERRLSTAEDHRSSLQSASVERLSRELGCDVEQIHRLRNDIAKARLDSLDRPVGSDDMSVPLSDTIVDRRDGAEEIVDQQELIGYLRDGVALLPERHRMVVVGYFFEGRSITDLGALLGVSQSRASQIKDEALKLLRSGIEGVYRDPGADPSTQQMSNRQRSYVESVAGSRSWRDRLATGEGISVTG
ncbi:MAG: sigma-70 family RNA polymerase sigma factor [Acidimicrobiales bacterium]